MLYNSRLEFETAEFLFKTTQLLEGNINTLLMLWAASLVKSGQSPPFANADDLHSVIDATVISDAPWLSFSVIYNRDIVATGNNEYYPLYLSIGNLFNTVRHAHHNALVLIRFLAIPKSEWQCTLCPILSYVFANTAIKQNESIAMIPNGINFVISFSTQVYPLSFNHYIPG